MTEGEVDWLAAIIVGGIAGWMADKFMHTHLTYGRIAIGVLGAIILNTLARIVGFHPTGWLEFMVIGFFGACLLLIPVRLFIVRSRPPRQPEDW